MVDFKTSLLCKWLHRQTIYYVYRSSVVMRGVGMKNYHEKPTFLMGENYSQYFLDR